MALLACTALVIAGDVNPPPGPVGDSGPSLSDLLGAVGAPGTGTAVVLTEFATPGTFTTVSSVDGVLQRAVLSNSINGATTFVHVRDATGVIVQLAAPSTPATQSVELGMRYAAPLEVAFVDLPNLSITLVIDED